MRTINLPRIQKFPILSALAGLVVALASVDASAQTTATWIGPATGNWSNPANWDIGVVPINNGPNTYNVIVPAGRTIEFDIGANSTISGLNLQDTGKINIAGGHSLHVSGFTLVAGIVTANGVGSNFTATSALTVFQPSPELHASNGAVLSIAANSYVNNRWYGRTFISSLGSGSQLNLSDLTSFDSNGDINNDSHVHTVEAGQGGVIDLSGTQSIDGAQGNDTLRFWIHTGGDINLQNLTAITKTNAQVGARTLFDLERASYELSSLQDAVGVEFKVRSGNEVLLPSLTGMRDSNLDLVAGATFDAPSLTDIRGSSIRVAGSANLLAPSFIECNDAELHAHSGGQITVAANSYVNNRWYGRTFISSLGSGSQLNLSDLTSFDSNGDINNDSHVHTVEAGQGGVIDLSGTQSIDGAQGNDTLRFWVHAGGDINLQNLTAITKTNAQPGARTLFDIDAGSYTLAELISADGAAFEVATFSAVNLPKLVSLIDGQLDVVALATVNAPLLSNVQGSFVRVSGATIVNTPAFTNIDNAELHAHSGGQITVAANSYVNNRWYGRTFISSLGSGSQLNLSDLTSFDSNGDINNDSHVHTVEAGQGGVIDLSGTQSIDGAQGNDVLRFFASGAGRINIGGDGQSTSLVGGRTMLEVNGTNSVIHFGSSMNMAANTAMKATLNGRFEAEGDLVIKTQTAADFDLADGQLRMTGLSTFDNQGNVENPQYLEVAGTDNGIPTGSVSNNFQIGLLQVGNSTIKSNVVLQNSVSNNANPFDSEALYLQGFPSETGLRLLGGSRLNLNGSNLYFRNSGNQWISARSLIPAGFIGAVFDSGVIALTAERGQVFNGDFGPRVEPAYVLAWNTSGLGTAGTVQTNFGSSSNEVVMKMTAGSMIEVWQSVSTLENDFFITMDALALNSTGTLSLLLDNQLLREWTITELGGTQPVSLQFLVSNPSLLNRIDVPIALRWNATTGHSVLIDNIRMFAAIPEPGALAIVALLGSLVAVSRRRRRV